MATGFQFPKHPEIRNLNRLQRSLDYVYDNEYSPLADIYKYLEDFHSREEIKELFNMYIDDVRTVGVY
jgi:hypothetical protein